MSCLLLLKRASLNYVLMSIRRFLTNTATAALVFALFCECLYFVKTSLHIAINYTTMIIDIEYFSI